MIPGEIIIGSPVVEINQGLETKKLKVVNKGDRPIQVGSHFHFFETNKFLSFDRAKAYGFRLDIPSGTAVRFEPGMEREVELVRLAGKQRVRGHNNLTNAQAGAATIDSSIEKAKLKNFI